MTRITQIGLIFSEIELCQRKTYNLCSRLEYSFKIRKAHMTRPVRIENIITVVSTQWYLLGHMVNTEPNIFGQVKFGLQSPYGD